MDANLFGAINKKRSGNSIHKPKSSEVIKPAKETSKDTSKPIIPDTTQAKVKEKSISQPSGRSSVSKTKDPSTDGLAKKITSDEGTAVPNS